MSRWDGRWRLRGAGWVAGAVLIVAAAAVALYAQRQESFPHLEHAGLFPLCAGCHEGIESGDRSAFYPPPESCAGCHDGTNLVRVEWAPPERVPSNLSFEHPAHVQAVRLREDRELDCVVCHTEPGAPRMAVRPAAAERCFDCHAHEARDHFVDARCESCHVPLAGTRFTRSRISALPEPSSHRRADFLEEVHGELARAAPEQCAVCHTRDLCVGCHVDPGVYPVIGQLPSAPPSLELPPVEARYSLPASHLDPGWLGLHGAEASAGAAACSTCHTRESCAGCHAVQPPAPVRALPSRTETAAPGVPASRRAPPSHQAPLFERQHGTIAAAAGGASCASCHTRSWCEACHNAPMVGASERAAPGSGPAGAAPGATNRAGEAGEAGEARAAGATGATGGDAVAGAAGAAHGRQAGAARTGIRASYHPPDFVARHPAEGWGRTLECSNCHDARLFCRDCHTQAGMSATGRLGSAFHDAQPLWLLRHGQAARQGLESCASCHGQRDCMQCHSELGAFRVNPHGPGFDPDRFRTRNQQICFACHISDPFARRQP